MDYEGEQAMEMEALEAIFMEDLQEYDDNLPQNWVSTGKTYLVMITPQEEDSSDEDEEYVAEFIFAHTPNYPDESPSIKIRSVTGLSDNDLKQLTSVIEAQIEENKGMAMIFNLIQAAKEWIQAKAAGCQEEDPDAQHKREAEEEERRRAALRSLGTAVTRATFIEWRTRFDAEVAAQKVKLAELQKDDEKARRLTGKAYFLKQWQAGEEAAGEEAAAEMDEEELAADAARALREGGSLREVGDEEELDLEDDIDYEDDDDEGMLDEL